jgi:uncharacterized membrane protein (UPF0136 family)
MKKINIGIWIYAFLCIVLVLGYRYYTQVFESKIYGYNLSLWFALVVNLVLLGFSVVSFKESKFLSLLGIVLVPLSTYSFYRSWTDFNYDYLAGFLAIPMLLLVLRILTDEGLIKLSTRSLEKFSDKL